MADWLAGYASMMADVCTAELSLTDLAVLRAEADGLLASRSLPPASHVTMHFGLHVDKLSCFWKACHWQSTILLCRSADVCTQVQARQLVSSDHKPWLHGSILEACASCVPLELCCLLSA